MFQFHYIFIAVVLCPYVRATEYYSSVESMKELLDIENYLLSTIEMYMEQETIKQSYVEDFLQLVEDDVMEGLKNGVSHYGNPVSALKIIKRVTKDWRDLYKFNAHFQNEEALAKSWQDLSHEKFKWPLVDELIGAVKGILRLQGIYKLDTSDMANGTLMGQKLSTEMLASDCYALGNSMLQVQNDKLAVSWLLEARKRLSHEIASQHSIFPLISDAAILEQLTPAVIKSGNTKLGLFLVREQITKNPNDDVAKASWAMAYQKIFEERLQVPSSNVAGITAERTLQRSKGIWGDEPLLVFEDLSEMPGDNDISNDIEAAMIPIQRLNSDKLTVTQLYEQTCRGDLRPTPRQQRHLRCRYTHANAPFCIIAPFKMEELSLDPAVHVYHNVVYDREIYAILNFTVVRLERSRVGLQTEVTAVSDIRTSQQTGIFLNEKFLKNFVQRLKDLTGLSTKSAEALQVANYGIGGHYSQHYDFADDGFDFDGKGNRLATALFYINDVDMGGATAFPFLHLAVPPEKYSMVVWNNMHKSLELDYRMMHAACPVLKGSKWICNEWFHERDQELMCDLKPDGKKSIKYKSRGYV